MIGLGLGLGLGICLGEWRVKGYFVFIVESVLASRN